MPLRYLYSIPGGLLLGIALALVFPAGGAYVAWLGQIFISVLKLLILPLILVSIYASLASGDNLRRIGGRTFALLPRHLRRGRHYWDPARPGLCP
jgi:Na+/H+-dicarboxylate symporter